MAIRQKSHTFAPVFQDNPKLTKEMHSLNELKDITHFLLEYANRLMGSGVHTSRVVRNTCRIGHSLDVETNVCVLQRNLLVSVRDPESHKVSNEMAAIPALPHTF